MKYVLAPNNVFKQFILPGEIVEFSSRCTTTAKRLEPEEAAEYGVSVLKMVTPPFHNPLTQTRTEADPVLVESVWTQNWVIADLTAAEAAAAATVAALAYKAQRTAEYPPMADYLDGIVKGDQAQVQAYIDACLAVKAKYPKFA